jgi:hypothetical protein
MIILVDKEGSTRENAGFPISEDELRPLPECLPLSTKPNFYPAGRRPFGLLTGSTGEELLVYNEL